MSASGGKPIVDIMDAVALYYATPHDCPSPKILTKETLKKAVAPQEEKK